MLFTYLLPLKIFPLFVSVSIKELLAFFLISYFKPKCIWIAWGFVLPDCCAYLDTVKVWDKQYAMISHGTPENGGMWWHSWLRRCATSQKVVGLITNGVIGIFHWLNPFRHATFLRLTQPLTEMCTRNISLEAKAVGAWGWQNYHLHVSTVLKSGSPNLLEPSGSVQACTWLVLPLPLPLPQRMKKKTTFKYVSEYVIPSWMIYRFHTFKSLDNLQDMAGHCVHGVSHCPLDCVRISLLYHLLTQWLPNSSADFQHQKLNQMEC